MIKMNTVYYDQQILCKLKVLSVQDKTVYIGDENGEKRLVNKYLWEEDIRKGILVEESEPERDQVKEI